MHHCGGSRHVSRLVGIANSDSVVGPHLARSRKTLIVLTIAASEARRLSSPFRQSGSMTYLWGMML
jgi:hypothetical protein